MASHNKNRADGIHGEKAKERPWVAKRTRDGQNFHLGYYATLEEAEAVEADFDRRRPVSRNRSRWGIKRFA